MTGSDSNGLFKANGVYRRVNRETVLLFGGATALLMQVAHPAIAAAVAEHSEYRIHPLRRLYATVNAMQTIIFDDAATARRTVDRIDSMHQRVTGELTEGTGRFPAGTPYAAKDPSLAMWVYATLTRTTLNVFGDLVRPLAPAEAESFYQESKLIAQLFGTPETMIPENLAAFRAYMANMIAGDELEITPTSRAVAMDILHPRISGFPRVLDDLVRVPALAYLPETLRKRYGFRWTTRHQAAWSMVRRMIKGTLPFTPHRLRVNRHARDAEQRLGVRRC